MLTKWTPGILLALLWLVSIGACGEQANGSDADLEVEDGDLSDAERREADAGADGDLDFDDETDHIDAEVDTDPDVDLDMDDDFDWRSMPYCELADGSRVNRCSECLPAEVGHGTRAALASMFPYADTIRVVEVDGEEHFVTEFDSATLGYAFLQESWGYNGPLSCLTGITADATTIHVEVVDAHWAEYTYMLSPHWYDRLRCISLDEVDIEARDFGSHRVDAVTGATITVDAMLDTVWQAFAHFERIEAL